MFANREWEDVGAIVINEQTAYKQPGNSHSSRHASLELLYGEKTGDHSSGRGRGPASELDHVHGGRREEHVSRDHSRECRQSRRGRRATG